MRPDGVKPRYLDIILSFRSVWLSEKSGLNNSRRTAQDAGVK